MADRNRSEFRKKVRTGTMLLAGICLLVMFQNFQPIPLKNLRPDFQSAHARALAAAEGTADMRLLAPERQMPDDLVLAQPQSGHDLSSITQDWMSRQSRAITGGADERLLADVNRRMNRIFKYEPLEEAFPSESDDDAAPPEGGAVRKPASDEDDSLGMTPTSMKFVALNHIQVGLKNKTKVSCAVEGDGVRWNVSRPIRKNFDVNLQHETAKSKSMLQLNYNW